MLKTSSKRQQHNILDTLKLDQALLLADQRIQLGLIDQARYIYEDILKIFPNNQNAFSGIASINAMSSDSVQDSFMKNAQHILDLYHERKLDQALAEANKLLKFFPEQASLYNILGAIYSALQKFSMAIANYKYAVELKPDYAEAFNNMGNALKLNGELHEAIKSYKEATGIKADYAEAHCNMGNALKEKGELDLAIESFKRAVKINPNYAKAYNNLGSTLHDTGDFDLAIDSYQQALKVGSTNAEIYNNIGNTLVEKGNFALAALNYRRALETNPECEKTYNNLGNAFQENGQFDLAKRSYEQALSINPSCAKSHNNLGVILLEKGELDNALSKYRQALKLESNYPNALLNSSYVYFLKGDFKKGFELYEWRHKQSKNSPTMAREPRRNLIWDRKENLKGKHFYVYEEGGLGDVIQFCRFLPDLEKNGARVTFSVRESLHKLIRTMNSNVILTAQEPEESEIDFEAPLMSLPYLLKTRVTDMAPALSYLNANDNLIKKWQKKLRRNKFKIGICWQGSNTKIDHNRSFPVSLYKDIANIPDVELISLHRGHGEEQLKSIDFQVTTLGKNFDGGKSSFLDTAAVMKNCDLIITSDTSIAHLAGALGRPTWVILKHVPDWRWMASGVNCPWYESVILYRQKVLNNWNLVFDQIMQDIQLMLIN